MNEQELKQAYYELACAEVRYRASQQLVGRPYKLERWYKLAYKLCVDEVSLIDACSYSGLDRGDVYQRKFKFVGMRTKGIRKQKGNTGRKFYDYGFKLECVERVLVYGFSKLQVTKDAGISYPSIDLWILKYKLGDLN